MFAHTQHAVREYMKISEKRTKKTDVKLGKLSKFHTSSQDLLILHL